MKAENNLIYVIDLKKIISYTAMASCKMNNHIYIYVIDLKHFLSRQPWLLVK